MMRDVIPAEELLNKASAIGQYYGFMPLSSLTAKGRGSTVRKSAGYPEALAHLTLDPVAEIVASFLKQFQHLACAPGPRQPLFVWHTNITPGRPAPKKAVIQFHALGTDRALSDAIVIHALIAPSPGPFFPKPTLPPQSMCGKKKPAPVT